MPGWGLEERIGIATLFDDIRVSQAARRPRMARMLAQGAVIASALVLQQVSADATIPRIDLAPVTSSDESAVVCSSPGDEMFELLARANPAELLTLLRGGDLSLANLSFAAEAAGRARLPPAEICAALTPLLHHPKGYIREGALYGLAQLDDDQARRLLGEVAATDVDEDVRQVAAEILEA